jgi:transitional endoplasmic reticulum ATPase
MEDALSLLSDQDFQSGLESALRGDFNAAIVSFEIASVKFPTSPEVFYELGLAYQRRAETSMPLSLLQREQADAPPVSGLVSSVGGVMNALLGLAVVGASKAVGQTDWIVRYRQDFRTSVDTFRQAIALDPTYAPAYYSVAHSLRYLGQAQSAAEHARKAAELEPGNRHYRARSSFIVSALEEKNAEKAAESTWDDVILPERTKKELRQMQLLLEKPALSRELGIEPPTGLLLYGPPGTGKTTIARVLAHESKCRFFATTSAQVNSMWLGESEKQVARLFAQARANAPAIIFLDEIDALLPSRSGGINMYSDKIVNQFLHEMDGLNRNGRVFVVGATNRRDMLDPALLRGGRLSREIEIPLPDLTARRSLFALSTRNSKLDEEVNLDSLAERTDGYSGANIKALVNEAGLQALIRLADSDTSATAIRRLSAADFEEALLNFEPSKQDPPTPWRMFG